MPPVSGRTVSIMKESCDSFWLSLSLAFLSRRSFSGMLVYVFLYE